MDAFYGCTNLQQIYFLGNPPGPDDASIFGLDSLKLYYLPGTVGWASLLDGVPTTLWNPQATSYMLAGGKFGFSLTGPQNATIVVETATNLSHPVWLPVSTNVLSSAGMSSFTDQSSGNNRNGFYRFRAP
jgi:hypothetical protein